MQALLLTKFGGYSFVSICLYLCVRYASNIVLQVHEVVDNQGGVDISGSCQHIRHSQSHDHPGAQAHQPDSKTTAVI